MRLLIKNMVCQRCQMAVAAILQELAIPYTEVHIGSVDGTPELTDRQKEQLQERLAQTGLGLIEDRKVALTEQVRGVVMRMIHELEELPSVNYSHYISSALGLDYTYLANTFRAIRGMTIQQYIIRQKIEKVKELLLPGHMTLTEISYKLNYSSVAHLSRQFRQVTGLNPELFRTRLAMTTRTGIDCI
jgi:AraC-like DNA-binding protein